MIRLFLVGLMMRENIEGMLRITLEAKHKTTRVDLLKWAYQCMITSEMHQKLDTLSW